MSLPKSVVVWYTLNNLPKEYEILKDMSFGDKLPSYTELEMRLLSEETSRKVHKIEEKESEVLLTYIRQQFQKALRQGFTNDSRRMRITTPVGTRAQMEDLEINIREDQPTKRITITEGISELDQTWEDRSQHRGGPNTSTSTSLQRDANLST